MSIALRRWCISDKCLIVPYNTCFLFRCALKEVLSSLRKQILRQFTVHTGRRDCGPFTTVIGASDFLYLTHSRPFPWNILLQIWTPNRGGDTADCRLKRESRNHYQKGVGLFFYCVQNSYSHAWVRLNDCSFVNKVIRENFRPFVGWKLKRMD